MRRNNHGSYRPNIYVRAVELDPGDSWRVKKTYPVDLVWDGEDLNLGVDPEFTEEWEKVRKDLDPKKAKYWSFVKIPHGDACEVATSRTGRETGDTEHRIAEESIHNGGRRIVAIHGKHATLVFVTPSKGGFEILFYEPRTHVDSAGDPEDPFLTGRHFIHQVEVDGSDDIPDLGDYAYLARVVRELVERCEERVAERLSAERRSRRPATLRLHSHPEPEEINKSPGRFSRILNKLWFAPS